jgi:hypothetical protein
LLTDLDDSFRMLTAWMQPFYPGRELAQPREIHAALGDVRVTDQVERVRAFPALYDVSPMARGMVVMNWLGRNDVSTQGAVRLAGAKGRRVNLILFGRQHQESWPLAIDAAYRWPIEANTHQLGDDDWLKNYFYKTMREIYWDLGFTDVDGQTFTRS